MKRWVFLLLATASYMASAETFTVHKGLTKSKAWMDQVARVANCVVKNADFAMEVSKYKKFTYTSKTPDEVAHPIVSANVTTELSTYYKKWHKGKLSKTIAYRNKTGKDTKTLYFNTYKNPRELSKMVATAIHEWLHVLGFGHGNNSAKGKGDSVNYAVAKISRKFVGACNV